VSPDGADGITRSFRELSGHRAKGALLAEVEVGCFTLDIASVDVSVKLRGAWGERLAAVVTEVPLDRSLLLASQGDVR